MPICQKTNTLFTISEHETTMRRKFGFETPPDTSPFFRFMQLGAFWQHWNLYKRKCDLTGNDIISPYRVDCPYPVWHKEEWIKNADPPSAEFDDKKELFSQMWDLFQKCPIGHKGGAGSENCEYCDTDWYSKDCYLSHFIADCERLRYCFRIWGTRDSQFCVTTYRSELCADTIRCYSCFNVFYSLNCRSCNNSGFLYDCRNCQNCLFCWNLRNKNYCYMNQQLSKDEYEVKKQELSLHSRRAYDLGKKRFRKIMFENAWHRGLFIDNSENSSGNYLDQCKNCENCYFVDEVCEDSINAVRMGGHLKDILDAVGVGVGSELCFNSANVADKSYDIRLCQNIIQCSNMEYCAHCMQCENCFMSCGLSGKKYYILNKPYPPELYTDLKNRIILHMKKTGEYGQFFPNHFSPVPYQDSIMGFYIPLTSAEQEKFGFRTAVFESKESNYLDPSLIPDKADDADASLEKKTFWDADYMRPFQIANADVLFAKKLGIPLPNTYYMHRIQDNLKWMPFNGKMRVVKCKLCSTELQTGWSEEYDNRILCDGCYEREIY